MGIHVCVQRHLEIGESWADAIVDHPEWDWIRYAGDRDIPTWFNADLAGLEAIPFPVGSDSDDGLMRPSEPEGFAYLRSTLPSGLEEWQRQRWELLLNILESNPDYGVHFSY